MQIFSYEAKNQNGEHLKGKVEARDKSQAADILRNKQLVIIKLKPAAEDGLIKEIQNKFGKVKSDDIVTFTRQLSTMITAGLPLTEGLSILQSQAKPQMAKIVSEILRDIQGGSSFGDALAAHETVFSDVYISLVRAGEAAGQLDVILARLADNEEKQRDFRAQVKGAMIYPAIVMIGMVIVMFVMMIFVIPKLTVMYDDFGAELPLVTQILIGVSEFSQKFWWLIIILAGGGVYAFRNWYKTKAGRKQIDALMIKMPIFGPLRTEIMMAEFSRTIALLVASGVSILEAMEIVTQAVDNVIFQESLKEAADGVEKGMPLAAMLARQEVFPPLLSQMVSVGEETGELDEVLNKVAVYFENEAANKIKNLTTAMEPVIMIVLGVGVGFLVIAIIMPLYNLTSQF